MRKKRIDELQEWVADLAADADRARATHQFYQEKAAKAARLAEAALQSYQSWLDAHAAALEQLREETAQMEARKTAQRSRRTKRRPTDEQGL